MIETGSDPAPGPRGALRVGGVSVAVEQLALALALGCERIYALAARMTPDLAALQHEAERAGARFVTITGPRGLLGQITASDELIAFADGLFPSLADGLALLEPGPVVLVQPADIGIEAGFERIDAQLASGGALRIPGRLIEQLADLPADCDAFSALLRVALQAAVARRPLPPAGQLQGFWALLRDEADAHALEPLWIRRRTIQVQPANPTRGLAGLLVRRLGPALLHAGSGARTVAASAGVLTLLGLGSGWFGLFELALMLTGLAWILGESAILLDRIEAERLGPQQRRWTWYGLFGWVIDAVLVATLGWALPIHASAPPFDRYFPPLMIIALLRIAPRTIPTRWTAWFEDRALLALILALALLAGVGEVVVHGLAVALALVAILWPRAPTRLTPP